MGETGRSRGRHAHHPHQIPLAGWRDIASRVVREVARDNLYLVAAGVAYYWLLAIFPALALVISLYGLVSDPHQVAQQLAAMQGLLPAALVSIVGGQLRSLASAPTPVLGLGVVLSTLFSVLSAIWGTAALMTALDIVYDESERRGFLRFYGVALLLTAGTLVFSVLALLLVIAAPAFLATVGHDGVGTTARVLIGVARWPVLAAAMMVFLAVLYRYGPSRAKAKWRWISWGAVLATLLWLGVSGAFSFYVSHFAAFNKTYGSVGAAVILLMWFYVSAYVLLLSAEIDAEIEHQTKMDTTVGPDRPMGERGAYVADTVGESVDPEQDEE